MTREEAIKEFKSELNWAELHNYPYVSKQKVEADKLAIKALEQEPRKGHWIKYDKEYFTAERLTPVIHSIRECSECHTRIADFCGEMKYCPNCSADMSEVEK